MPFDNSWDVYALRNIIRNTDELLYKACLEIQRMNKNYPSYVGKSKALNKHKPIGEWFARNKNFLSKEEQRYNQDLRNKIAAAKRDIQKLKNDIKHLNSKIK